MGGAHGGTATAGRDVVGRCRAPRQRRAPGSKRSGQVRHARDLLAHTVSSIARLLNVSRSTIYKYVPAKLHCAQQPAVDRAHRARGRHRRSLSHAASPLDHVAGDLAGDVQVQPNATLRVEYEPRARARVLAVTDTRVPREEPSLSLNPRSSRPPGSRRRKTNG
jgi:hypothetical protein